MSEAPSEAAVPTISTLPPRTSPPCGTVPDPDDDQFDRVALAVDGFCGHASRISVDVAGAEVLTCVHHYEAAIERAAEMAGVDVAAPDVRGEQAVDYDVEVLRDALDAQASDLDEEIPWCDDCDAPIIPDGPGAGLRCGTCGEPAVDHRDAPGRDLGPTGNGAATVFDGDAGDADPSCSSSGAVDEAGRPDATGQTTLDEWSATD